MDGRFVADGEFVEAGSDALITASGRSHGALARKVNAVAADQHDVDLRYDQASVYWWLRGRVPEPPVPEVLAMIFRDLLGRPITLDDLGFTDRGELGLTVAATTGQATETASQLWRHVVQRRTVGSAFVLSAAVGAGFDWHFAPSHPAHGRSEGSRAVSGADVERLHQARAEFVALDRANGGGHAFTWLVDHLDRAVTPLLASRYTADVGRDLFSAVASLTELAGWMAYDQHRAYGQGLAQRFFIQALSLARQSGDRAYAAHILSNLATQALFLDHGAEAARLARAARSGAGRAATPTLAARLAVVEARGWALVGDRREARAAIRRADHAMDRSDPSSDPRWLATFTPAHHAGSVMHALRDLGLYNEAAEYAGVALDLPDANVRTRALHQVLLATVHASCGDLDAACATARQALEVYPYLASARLRARLVDFSRRLPHQDVRCVRDYIEQARELLTTS
ncbi:hypothetical protein [Nonomuraea ceibae]|uniref:hypothetical protein n=1 Tax=Nonomuraea ceibae TaxID=1935170 RepID=UPI001C5E0915|nr:hypothetical protein [Nonomuraea ceibae]